MGHLELRTKVKDIIRKAIVLQDDDTESLLNHLFSNDISVQSIADLAEVTIDLLPKGMMGIIPGKNLIKAFGNAAAKAAEDSSRSRSRSPNSTPSSRSGSMSQAGPSSDQSHTTADRPILVFAEGEFRYIINWRDMPVQAVQALNKARREEKEGESSDIKDLIEGIEAKSLKAYKDYQKLNPHVTQKTPGIKICRDLATQVVTKFGIAMQESLGTNVYGDGWDTTVSMLKVFFENVTRNKNKDGVPEVPCVSKGVGVPGVLKDQYQPHLSRKCKLQQMVIQESLIKMKEQDPDLYDWREIRKKMVDTFPLQRDEIVELTRKLVREAGEEEDTEAEANEDEPDQRAMIVIKKNWPFLFFSSPINDHHKRLTGIDLQERLERFLAKDQLQYLPMFFTSCSSKNTLNCVLKLKSQENGPCSNGGQFLLTVLMAANHFNEHYKNFLLTAERTLTPDEIECIPDLPSGICIIALGSNPFSSHQYYITLDKVCVAEKANPMEALLMLISMCFVFDVEYPAGLSLTFEFIERIVLEMTPKETRVKNKKGKVLLVLTDAVKKAGKAFHVFLKAIQDGLPDF